MLSAAEIERITALWTPDEWPPFADPYVIQCHQTPFFRYVERVKYLGLSGGVLIDAGCGSGRWAFAWATKFDRVIGFDYTPSRVEAALWMKGRLDIPSVDFVAGDIRNIPAEDESADVTYSNSVAIGHVPMASVLSECYRVLKPGGICYMGLNGPGFAHELTRSGDPERAALGQRRKYYTYCQRYLGQLIARIRPGGDLNAQARMSLARHPTPAAVLIGLRARTDQLLAAELVARYLDAEFTQTLLDDLTAMTEGQRTRFSHNEAGQDFEPHELTAVARGVGFGRTEWALDGCLSLAPDGSVSKGPCPEAKPNPGDFEGWIRVFEMLMWKPTNDGRERSTTA